MALITVTIIESERQRISGVPEFVTLSTSIPSTIYYTLDGTDPSTYSLVYAGGELSLPTNQPSVTLKIFATNGADSSAIIERHFRPNIILGRQSHDRVILSGADCDDCDKTFPYATSSSGIPAAWTSIGTDDLIVDKPGVDNIFDGYDGMGNVVGGTDLNLSEYLIKFSDSNRQNTERGRGIGTLPSEVTIAPKEAPPTSSDRNDNLFNPRALVIYQDSRTPPDDPNVVNINRQFFSLPNAEVYKDGALLNTTGLEGNVPTGSLLRTHFNPRDNTMRYYYFDSQALRWIISIEPFTPPSARTHGLQNIVFSSRGAGDRKVFRWIPFKGSRLI
jgi:hypothetical protein